MDGLRKVPDNVPNGDMLRGYLGKPLTRIPDPFGTHASFGAHNNARLRAFLDSFGFDYEFASATDYYESGRFDAALLRVLALHDEIRAVILPTLGPERRATYSPILPLHPRIPARSCRCRSRPLTRRRHRHLGGPGGRALHHASDRRGLQAAMEGGLGDALVRPRRGLRNERQGPDRQRPPVQPGLPGAGGTAAANLHL